MENFNKLGLLCVVMALFVAGCGKKKTSTSQDSTKKMASAGTGSDIPEYKEETENLLEEDIADFAFVDDEALDENGSKVGSKLASLDEDVEIDDSVIQSDEGSSNYGFKTVQFGFNKNTISKDQATALNEDIELGSQAVEQGKDVIVQGHTCQIGSAGYNLALSQRRAEAVKAKMVAAGIAPEKIKTVGYGYEKPLVWSDEKNHAQLIKELSPNRRAEVLVN